MKTFTGKECLSCGLDLDRWLSLWHVRTNEWDRNRSACLFIKGDNSALCSCFRTQRAHCAALHFYALSSRGQCANKASNSSNKLLIEAKAACKSDVCSGSFFSRSSSTFCIFVKLCRCPSLRHRVVYLTSHRGCLCFNFPKCRGSPVSHFSLTFLPIGEMQPSQLSLFSLPRLSVPVLSLLWLLLI